LKRGEIWIGAGGPDYAGKPRPFLIIQSDQFDETVSVIVCAITGTDIGRSYFRVHIRPTPLNGLAHQSYVMVDKITSLRRPRLHHRAGELTRGELILIDRALFIFLGLVE
jgi:mRNA interferase MazF